MMMPKSTLKLCVSAFVLLAVPVAALTLFAPTVTQTHADGMVGLDGVLSVDADVTNELEVVNLSNWTYTDHKPGHCPPGLAKKGPGHPGWENVCSPS
jgi:hypothetical protein